MFGILYKINELDYIHTCHIIITIFLAVSPYILPLNLLYYYITFFLSVICHWYFLEGRCFMVNYQHNNDVLFSSLSNINNIYDIVISTNIIFTFYRLGLLLSGIFILMTLIGLNKIIYNNLGFRMNEFNNDSDMDTDTDTDTDIEFEEIDFDFDNDNVFETETDTDSSIYSYGFDSDIGLEEIDINN